MTSSDSDADLSLCNAENFSPSKWLTLGRSHIEDPPHCPLVGEYTGVLPDAEGLCAKSYTDCNNPEVMFYTVFNCQNQSEVYEEREYRCFGQWEEQGLVYTYTERRDLPGNECFVGVTVDEDRNVVTEAGQNCERGHQPEKYGMTLHRQAKCSSQQGDHQRHGGGDRRQKHPPKQETIEELLEEEERDLLESEARTVSPRLVNTKVKHRDYNNEEDIFTNEIPGSYSANGAASYKAMSSVQLLLVLTIGLAATWWR